MSTSTTSTTSKRKPFAIGARVYRQVDGERGAVESVKTFSVDGQSCWAVAVRMDSDNEVWSGTQSTATRGAWRKLSAEELAAQELHNELDALAMDAAAAVKRGRAKRAELDAAKKQESDAHDIPSKKTHAPTLANTVTQTQMKRKERAQRAAATRAANKMTAAAAALVAAETELDARAHARAAKSAQKRAQHVSCDFYECDGSASTTRELAGRAWNVCGVHA